jgi:hypothetical protein
MCSKCAPMSIEAIKPAQRSSFAPAVLSPRVKVWRELLPSIFIQFISKEDNENENHFA